MAEALTETAPYTCEVCGHVSAAMWQVWHGIHPGARYYVCKNVAECNARRPALAPTP